MVFGIELLGYYGSLEGLMGTRCGDNAISSRGARQRLVRTDHNCRASSLKDEAGLPSLIEGMVLSGQSKIQLPSCSGVYSKDSLLDCN